MTNRLSVSSPATLLSHAGAGHQLKLNKAAAADTASLLFQTGFSGRAELGLAGSDTFEIKVSADGAAFVTGLSIAGASGQVTLPAAVKLGGQASDPAAPLDGMMWLNTTTGEIKMRSNGASVVIAAAGGITDGDKGDITVAGGLWSVDAGAISNTKLAIVATATLKGRSTAGTGAPEDLTPVQVATMLPTFTSSTKGVVPGSGGGPDNFLRADGSWASAASTLDSLGVTATAAQINGGLMPAGAVMHFAMALPPAGWLKAAGQLVSRSTYDDLFAAIGTLYGAGDGVTTFKLPDLRGEFVRGFDDARGVDAARVLGSAQMDAFQGHTFGDSDQPTFVNLVAVNQRIATVTTNTAVSNVALTTAATDVVTAGSNAILRPIALGTNGTPRLAAETRTRNIALLACIKT
jgi:microcystin-dependent protein